MSIPITDKLKPSGIGGFALMDAEDVEMPDGSRLSEFTSGSYPIVEGVPEVQPEKFYDFGTVDSMTVTLQEKNDGIAHEYCFEFVAAEGFTELKITPEIRWYIEPRIIPGLTHQVSIVRNVGVMIVA